MPDLVTGPVETGRTVCAVAQGKVNLSLHVGAVGDDGYHPVRSVFQALTLTETVTARDLGIPAPTPPTVHVRGIDAHRVPGGAANIVTQAARALAAHAQETNEPGLADRLLRSTSLTVHKSVPVAGGMAGGSADAAATLVALDELWGLRTPREELHTLAARLGADVPFTLLGGTAEGTGRGEQLRSLPSSAPLRWVLAVRDEGLSTAEVYRRFDREGTASTLDPELDAGLAHALAVGDASGVGAGLYNDLEPVALAAIPALALTKDVARDAGALGALVSGSGPTLAVLVRDDGHASEMEQALRAARAASRVVHAWSCPHGARHEDPIDEDLGR